MSDHGHDASCDTGNIPKHLLPRTIPQVHASSHPRHALGWESGEKMASCGPSPTIEWVGLLVCTIPSELGHVCCVRCKDEIELGKLLSSQFLVVLVYTLDGQCEMHGHEDVHDTVPDCWDAVRAREMAWVCARLRIPLRYFAPLLTAWSKGRVWELLPGAYPGLLFHVRSSRVTSPCSWLEDAGQTECTHKAWGGVPMAWMSDFDRAQLRDMLLRWRGNGRRLVLVTRVCCVDVSVVQLGVFVCSGGTPTRGFFGF